MKFLHRYLFLIILTLVAGFISFFWFGQRKADTPLKRDISTQDNVPSIDIGNININKLAYPVIEGQVIPESTSINISATNSFVGNNVGVFSVTPINISHEGALKISKELGFVGPPAYVDKDVDFGTYYSWTSNISTLSIRLSPLEILFSKDPSLYNLPSSGLFPSVPTVQNFMKEFLDLTGLSFQEIGLSFTPQEIILDGNILDVGANFKIDDYLVTGNNPDRPLVSAQFQKDGNLFGFSYLGGFSGYVNVGNYPIKDGKDILKAINTEGKIIAIGESTESPVNVQPTSIEITKLDTFLFHSQNYLFPMLKLSGTSQTNLGSLPIIIYMPAVSSEYIQVM